MRHPTLHLAEDDGITTAYGGLALAAGLVQRLGLAKVLADGLKLLRTRRPFSEADHVLTHVYNLYIGGGCIEDIGYLQGSESVRRLLGAERLPDPTTAGDFLRRFGKAELEQLDGCIDEGQRRVWKQRYGKRKQELALVDLDSHVRPVYGAKKEGADFSYKGTWAYHPLVITLAGTQEILRLVNRPGNVASSEDAEVHLASVMPMLCDRFRRVVVRGDSAFCNHHIIETCEQFGQFFAIVMAGYPNVQGLAESVPSGPGAPSCRARSASGSRFHEKPAESARSVDGPRRWRAASDTSSRTPVGHRDSIPALPLRPVLPPHHPPSADRGDR